MGTSFRVLVIEDSEPFRKFICLMLLKRPELEIVGEVADGLEGVQKAEELDPDLIVLDIGLPSLNGLEAARRIRKVSSKSKILFVSQESSADVVQEALDTGAQGYIVKADAGELLQAIDAVLRGERFVGTRFAGHIFVGPSHAGASQEHQGVSSRAHLEGNTGIAHSHDVVFYSDDAGLLDDLTPFITAALTAGAAAVVVATEPHRDSLLLRLQRHGTDIAEAIEQGRYISVDAADAVSTFMINGMLDPVRYLNLFHELIVRAAEAAKGAQARIAVFGESVDLLWAQGKAEAAIQVEGLCNQLVETYGVHILCGYSLRIVQGGMESPIEKICAEHSAVYSR